MKRRNDKRDQPTNRTGNSPSRPQKTTGRLGVPVCRNGITKRHDKTTKRHNERTSRTFCPRSTFIVPHGFFHIQSIGLKISKFQIFHFFDSCSGLVIEQQVVFLTNSFSVQMRTVIAEHNSHALPEHKCASLFAIGHSFVWLLKAIP